MNDKVRKISRGRYKRRRNLIRQHISHAIDRERLSTILDYSSKVHRLDTELDVEQLYLIATLSLNLSELAMTVDDMDLAFMLEITSRAAEESLGEALGL